MREESQSELRAERLAALAGLFGPVCYVATWAIAGGVRDGYSPFRDAISELAEQRAVTAPAMSTAFVLFGVTGLALAWLVHRRLPGSGVLAGAMAVTSVATMAAAAFPCSPGCPGAGSSFTDNGHAVMATVGYLALMASPLLAARLMWSWPGWRGFARWSLVAGVLASLGMLAWALGLAGESHGGLLQRSFNTLVDIWWAALALRLMGPDGHPTVAAAGGPGVGAMVDR